MASQQAPPPPPLPSSGAHVMGLGLPIPSLPILSQPPPFTIPPSTANLSMPPPSALGAGAINFPPPNMFDSGLSDQRSKDPMGSPNSIEQQLNMTQQQISMVQQQINMIQAQGMGAGATNMFHAPNGANPLHIFDMTHQPPMDPIFAGGSLAPFLDPALLQTSLAHGSMPPPFGGPNGGGPPYQ